MRQQRSRVVRRNVGDDLACGRVGLQQPRAHGLGESRVWAGQQPACRVPRPQSLSRGKRRVLIGLTAKAVLAFINLPGTCLVLDDTEQYPRRPC